MELLLKDKIQPVWDFEQEPHGEELMDETSFNLRAYFDRMPDEMMLQYSPEWSDEIVMQWETNFKEDGDLMIACSERDIDVAEYRRVLHQAIEYRNRVRPSLS